MVKTTKKARIRRPNFAGQRFFWLGVLGVVLIGALLVGSTLYKAIGFGENNVDVEFVQAAGMRPGDEVRVAGIPVGSIKSTKLEGDHVLATLGVKKNVHLGPDAHATIKMSTILGAHYIELKPGDGSGLPGNRIPISNSTVPYDLAKTVETGTPLLEAIDTKKLAKSLDLLNDQLGDSPKLTGQALDSVGSLAKIINDRRTQVDSLLKNLDHTTQLLSDNRNNLLLIIANGQAIGNRIFERQQMLRQLLDNVGTLSKQLQDIGANNNGQLGPLIQQLDTMSQGLQKNTTQLDNLLQIMPVTLRQLSNVFGNGNYGDVNVPWLFPDNWLCKANVIEGCAG
ncbi:MCE family protein [Antrihabitans cavernicola]|uniref:MCE family protein n=1 Tax=Antrihabitans cavernicola TaxID=2495913 RepID=A0A5A7S3G4_9NOCA|nr:MCE family protein [Spelaeibacter cavernicola]KAA0019437.1 MCE family protein [Spelaeibacter cavernicola]